jgi:hypothetical protein
VNSPTQRRVVEVENEDAEERERRRAELGTL